MEVIIDMVKEAFKEFSRPSPAIDAVIFRTMDAEVTTNRGIPRKLLQTLLIRRKNSNEKWHLPGTMLRLGEKGTDAIDRILNDKAQIGDIYYEQLYTVDNNPERDERGHIISIVYIAIAKENQQIVLRDDSLYEAKWFWVNNDWLDKDNGIRTFKDENTLECINKLEYDHSEIFEDALKRIQGKLMYTNIGFNFVDKTFTIKELENVFVAINMKNIPSFRRTISSKIQSIGLKEDGKAFRPAELFKLKD